MPHDPQRSGSRAPSGPRSVEEVRTLQSLLGETSFIEEDPDARAGILRDLVARGFVENPAQTDMIMLEELLSGRTRAREFMAQQQRAQRQSAPQRRRPPQTQGMVDREEQPEERGFFIDLFPELSRALGGG